MFENLICQTLVTPNSFVIYGNAHWSVHFCLIVVKRISLQSYDKVSINSSVYNLTVTKRVFTPLLHISPHFPEFQAIEKTT